MHLHDSPELSIIIPLFNEEWRFTRTCRALERFAAAHLVSSFEVVCVDDGSRDKTAELVSLFAPHFPSVRLVSHSRNRGKGAAVKTGMLAARGKWRLVVDADMATDLLELRKCIPALEAGAPVVIGSRRRAGALVRVHQPRLREVLGGVYTRLANFFTRADVSDFTCGFKVFSAHAAKQIFSHAVVERWSYDAEILFLARYLSFSITEVPVVWHNDGATRVRLWRDAPRAFFDLLLIRVYAWTGRYDARIDDGATNREW